MSSRFIYVIIPALNEEAAISKVLEEIPLRAEGIEVKEIIVCDNGSTDATASVAENHGATVLSEPTAGYGRACLKGMDHLKEKISDNDIVVFLDGDHSDYPDEMKNVVKPILNNQVDMVIGSRALGERESGSMMPQQIFGNWLATNLIKLFYKVSFTDLGPFRAIHWKALESLEMKDKTYGWTVEMQVKAAKKGLKICEVPVNYRQRIGVSKVAGTLKGTILAGYKIIMTIFKYL